jgi:carbonic anhydrase
MHGAASLLVGTGMTIILRDATDAATVQKGTAVTADQALEKLMAGNKRYVAGKPTRHSQGGKRRRELARGQQPFASILCCSDSRVPPEIIFDQGLGDLFVVRVAGNVADDPGIGSLEYGAAVLGAPLLMVLGHSSCGAVEATLKGGEVPGHIGSLVKLITPAVEKAKGQPGDVLDNAIRGNVTLMVGRVKTTTPILADLVEKKTLRVVGGHYDLAAGTVELIG